MTLCLDDYATMLFYTDMFWYYIHIDKEERHIYVSFQPGTGGARTIGMIERDLHEMKSFMEGQEDNSFSSTITLH